MKTDCNEEKMIRDYIKDRDISLMMADPLSDYIHSILTIVMSLPSDEMSVRRTIVIASKHCIEYEWLPLINSDHSLMNLSFTAALGRAARKIRSFSSSKKLILVNDESLEWIRKVDISCSDMLILSELSRYRHYRSERYQQVKYVCRHVGKIVAFTTQPLPHGLSELWDEVFLLDAGKRLGNTKSAFLDRYFYINRIWTDGHMKIYSEPKPGATEAIGRALKGICMDLPAYSGSNRTIYKNIYVDLSSSELSWYRIIEKQLSVRIEPDSTISSVNDYESVGKLLQLSGGAVYGDDGKAVVFHDHKIASLRITLDRLQEQNVLIVYGYKHELERLKTAFPGARTLLNHNDMREWNEGRIHIGLINASMGGSSGDLSGGGNIIIWFSLVWSLKLYTKTNLRIAGDHDALIMHVIANNTIDLSVLNTLNECRSKNDDLKRKIRLGKANV